MLFFNFHCGPLIILLLSVFIQVTISEKYNLKYVSFHEHETLYLKIIFKNAMPNSPVLVLKYLNMEDCYISDLHDKITYNNATYKVYENVSLTPSNGSLLYVHYYHVYPINTPLMKFISRNNNVHVHRSPSSCTIEFGDWDLGDRWLTYETNNANNPQYADGPQKIHYTRGDSVTIELVHLYNIPKEVHHVGLIKGFNKAPVEGAGKTEVEGQSHVFNKFNFTLLAYDVFKILIRLYSSKNDEGVIQDIQLLHFIEVQKRTKKHLCLDKCKISYDFNQVNNLSPELDASTACHDVQTSLPTTIQSTISERTTTSTRLTTITTNTETTITTDARTTITKYAGTTITTDAGTTTTTDAGTTITTTINPNVKTALKIDTNKTLAIVLPIVAVVLVVLITAGIYWHRRNKAPNPETDDTYLYATQLNYAQLELESSELYEAPKKDYVSVYTRVIGVLKPRSST